MDSSRSSEIARLERAVRGDGRAPGLATVLPLLQVSHRRELRSEPHWSKEALVRHPEPRELIRSMRKPGNLDDQGRPVYTLDERRSLSPDIYENRVVKEVVHEVRRRLEGSDDPEATPLLRDLGRAEAQAPFLRDVRRADHPTTTPTATLTGDPLYRAVLTARRALSP